MPESTPNPNDLITPEEALPILWKLWPGAPQTISALLARSERARMWKDRPMYGPPLRYQQDGGGLPKRRYSRSELEEWARQYKMTPETRERLDASMPTREPPEGALAAFAWVEPESGWCYAARDPTAWVFTRLSGRLLPRGQRAIAWLPIPAPPAWAEGGDDG